MPLPSLIVYYDESYPTSWLRQASENIPLQIRDYLMSHGFAPQNAQELRDWMIAKTSANECHGTVIVFAQDVAPETVVHAADPNCLLRKYLDKGGKIVWMGDVPFWHVGEPNARQPRQPDWGPIGPYTVLGSIPLIVASPAGKVEVTDIGVARGLQSMWYGTRPMAWPMDEEVTDLAISVEKSPVELPERTPAVVTKERFNLTRFLRDAHDTWSVYRKWFVTVLGVLVTASALILALPMRFRILVALVGLSILSFWIATYLARRVPRTRHLKNAWHKNYNVQWPQSGFVRIWDGSFDHLDSSQLAEIEQVARSGLV